MYAVVCGLATHTFGNNHFKFYDEILDPIEVCKHHEYKGSRRKQKGCVAVRPLLKIFMNCRLQERFAPTVPCTLSAAGSEQSLTTLCEAPVAYWFDLLYQ